jgi:hypothetical protein
MNSSVVTITESEGMLTTQFSMADTRDVSHLALLSCIVMVTELSKDLVMAGELMAELVKFSANHNIDGKNVDNLLYILQQLDMAEGLEDLTIKQEE